MAGQAKQLASLMVLMLNQIPPGWLGGFVIFYLQLVLPATETLGK